MSLTDQRLDHVVYRLRKLVPLGDRAPRCDIRVGDFDGYGHAQRQVPPSEVLKVPGKLPGAAADWYQWSSEGGLVAEVAGGPGQNVHVSCWGTSDAEVHELRTLVDTLRAR